MTEYTACSTIIQNQIMPGPALSLVQCGHLPGENQSVRFLCSGFLVHAPAGICHALKYLPENSVARAVGRVGPVQMHSDS